MLEGRKELEAGGDPRVDRGTMQKLHSWRTLRLEEAHDMVQEQSTTEPATALEPVTKKPRKKQDRRRRADGLEPSQVRLIEAIKAGKTIEEAARSAFPRASLRRGRWKVSRWLEDADARGRIVARLAMAQCEAGVHAVLAYSAALAASKALGTGDARVVLALLGKAPAKPSNRQAAKPQVVVEDSEGV